MKFKDIIPGMLVEVGESIDSHTDLYIVDSIIDDGKVYRVLRGTELEFEHYCFLYIDAPDQNKGLGYNNNTFEHNSHNSRFNMLNIWSLPEITGLGLPTRETRKLLWSKKVPSIKMTVNEMEEKLTELLGIQVEWVRNDI